MSQFWKNIYTYVRMKRNYRTKGFASRYLKAKTKPFPFRIVYSQPIIGYDPSIDIEEEAGIFYQDTIAEPAQLGDVQLKSMTKIVKHKP